MKTFILVLALVATTLFSYSQGTIEDYRRAETADTSYLNKVYNTAIEWDWVDNRFWYNNRTKSGKEFILVDPAKKSKGKAFDHQKLATALGGKTNKKINPNKLPFDEITFRSNGTLIEFVSDSVKWQCNLKTYQLTFVERLKPNPYRYWGTRWSDKEGSPVTSPDSNWVALVKNSNIYIRDRKTKEEFRLSNDGSEGEYYSPQVKWSPDSKKLMAYKVRPGEERKIYFVESSPKDQLQPKLQSRDYLKPGDALPIKMPQLFLIDSKTHVKIPHNEFASQFSLSDFEWRHDSRSFTFEYNQRGHGAFRIIEVEAPSGKVNVLIDEQTKTFFDYAGKSFRYDIQSTAEGGTNEIVWMSERDGWNHLYLYDWKGNVKNQITKGEWL